MLTLFNQDFYDELIKKLGEDYKYEDTYDDDDDEIDDDDDDGIDDYDNKNIPLSRVTSDRDFCINHISEILNKSNDISEIEIALTMYSNFYIRYGMASRFQAENISTEYDGLELIFDNLSEHKGHLMKVYEAAKYQNDSEWYKILDNNPDSIVAKLYIFLKLFNDYSCVAAEHKHNIDVDKFENNIDVDKFEKMWSMYESLPSYVKKYVLENNYSNSAQFFNTSLLPYINFKPSKERLSEFIQMYYKNILDTLDIPSDIDSGSAFNEIFKSLGLQAILDVTLNFSNENKLILQEFAPEKCQNNLNNKELKAKANEMMHKCLEYSSNTANAILNFENQIRKVGMDLTFIAEKLHDLINGDFDASWFDSSDLLEECSWDGMSQIERCGYLHIPVVSNISISLFKSHFETYKKNQKIERNTRQKIEMMDYYAHSWKHISYPSIVRDIAKELEKTNQALSNRLMKVYNSERTLQMGIQLLQYISSDNEAKVSEEFKNSMSIPNFDDNHTLSLEQVINDSLDIVVFKILMSESDDSKSIQNCRNKWNKNQSLELLSQDYTKKYISDSNTNQGITDWVSENFFNITININDSWNSVRFIKDRFAVNQFKEILVEIFTNAFLHGKEYMNLNFTSNSNELLIETENPSEGSSNTQSGLSTLKNLLDHLNYGTNIKSLSCINDNPFKLTIRLNKKLMIVRCL